ncbi:hypothetical protein BC939DRAFT_437653 [Gamsiella multidivaricata]|uniref:uncharacterized protein n=1 Tax=Gamsiella multidivaricata TaxID=101098 RepID=UPI0022201E4B|nr:uncharacterized protein BC939DRAFT_437653 [Gamsiella multidivaricata]KAI7831123.1 hypothetical protein BC939DRAFT_437653 [Gamsiella multidivaricata]
MCGLHSEEFSSCYVHTSNRNLQIQPAAQSVLLSGSTCVHIHLSYYNPRREGVAPLYFLVSSFYSILSPMCIHPHFITILSYSYLIHTSISFPILILISAKKSEHSYISVTTFWQGLCRLCNSWST